MKSSRLFKVVSIGIASLYVYACSHPIEIVGGEGDVTSASGNRNCSLEDFQTAQDNCTKNYAIGAYQETYYATPRAGFQFDHWGNNYCPNAPPPNYDCSFDIPAATVYMFLGQTMPPLQAVFTCIYPSCTLRGLSPFGYFYNSGFRPTADLGYAIASRIIIFGYRLETMVGRQELFNKIDASSNIDRTNFYYTITSELSHNRWTGQDNDPQKAYCLPQGPDRQKMKDIFKMLVERYDGDTDYGCKLNNGTDCYVTGDKLYPSADVRKNISLHPINNWQIENEIFDQYVKCAYIPANDTYTFPKSPLGVADRPVKEDILAYLKEISLVIKNANSKAQVIFPSFTALPQVMLMDKRTNYIEIGFLDCDYQKFSYEQATDLINAGLWNLDTAKYVKSTIEYLLINGQGSYDTIDFHDYSNDPYFTEAVMGWFSDILGSSFNSKRVISTENSGPWNFFVFMPGAIKPSCEATKACATQRCSAQPYSEAVLSEHVVKRYVVGFASGLDTLFWATLTELVEGFNDNFNRLGLIADLDHTKPTTGGFQEKPAYYTYILLVEKLSGFVTAQEIQTDVYKFTFKNKNPVYVAWSESGNRTVDLSQYLTAPEVKVTYIFTSLDSNGKPVYKTGKVSSILSNKSMPLTSEPIFLE